MQIYHMPDDLETVVRLAEERLTAIAAELDGCSYALQRAAAWYITDDKAALARVKRSVTGG